MRRVWLCAAIVPVVTALAFAMACGFGLSMCDDYFYVNESPLVYGGLSAAGVRYAFTQVGHAIWMPLSYLSYMLDYSLGWGFGGMHLQNILWHAASALMLFLVLRELFGSAGAALVGTLVWSVHPLRVESVVWIASRKDVISTFFLLAALLAWIKAEPDRPGWLVASIAFLLLGASAKPSVMVFPVFALAVDLLVLRRPKRTDAYLVIVLLSFLIAVESGWAQRIGGATFYSGLIPVWYRMLNACASMTVYAGNTIWPSDLAIQCMIRYPQLPRFSPVGLLAILLAVWWMGREAGAGIARWRRRREVRTLFEGGPVENAVFAGLLVFFGGFIPFLGIAGFGVHAFADRFTLLPALGVSLAITAVLSRFAWRTRNVLPWSAVVAGLVYATSRQTAFWRDDTTLLERTLAADRRENIDIQRALGLHYWETRHDMEKVHSHLKRAFDLAWSEDVRNSLYGCMHFLIEACYETGRVEEGDVRYLWLKRTEAKLTGRGPSPRLLMAEALFDLNTRSRTRIEQAEAVWSQLKEIGAEDYIVATVGYHIAKARNDPQAIADAVAQCAAIDFRGKYFSCRWAKRPVAADGR